MQQSAVLVLTLQSNWLMMYVSMMMLNYATLLLKSLLAIAFLCISFERNMDFPIHYYDTKPSILSFLWRDIHSSNRKKKELFTQKNLFVIYRLLEMEIDSTIRSLELSNYWFGIPSPKYRYFFWGNMG